MMMENAKVLQDELAKYKRSYERIVKRNRELDIRYAAQEGRIRVLTSSVENCQKALDINKGLLRQVADEHSRKEASLIDVMNLLKAKLRELGYDGDLDHLGH